MKTQQLSQVRSRNRTRISHLHFADRVFSFLSLAIVPLMGAVALSWVFTNPPTATVNLQKPFVEYVGPDNSFSAPDVEIALPMGKAFFYYYLADTDGNPAYVWPSHRMEGQTLQLHPQLDMPRMRPGTYVLQAKIVYPLNPFKNGELNVSLATIVAAPSVQGL